MFQHKPVLQQYSSGKGKTTPYSALVPVCTWYRRVCQVRHSAAEKMMGRGRGVDRARKTTRASSIVVSKATHAVAVSFLYTTPHSYCCLRQRGGNPLHESVVEGEPTYSQKPTRKHLPFWSAREASLVLMLYRTPSYRMFFLEMRLIRDPTRGTPETASSAIDPARLTQTTAGGRGM